MWIWSIFGFVGSEKAEKSDFWGFLTIFDDFLGVFEFFSSFNAICGRFFLEEKVLSFNAICGKGSFLVDFWSIFGLF